MLHIITSVPSPPWRFLFERCTGRKNQPSLLMTPVSPWLRRFSHLPPTTTSHWLHQPHLCLQSLINPLVWIPIVLSPCDSQATHTTTPWILPLIVPQAPQICLVKNGSHWFCSASDFFLGFLWWDMAMAGSFMLLSHYLITIKTLFWNTLLPSIHSSAQALISSSLDRSNSLQVHPSPCHLPYHEDPFLRCPCGTAQSWTHCYSGFSSFHFPLLLPPFSRTTLGWIFSVCTQTHTSSLKMSSPSIIPHRNPSSHTL